jgi:ADP-ribose pyrophosphatase YjhB (NUDIX family)
MDEREFLEQYRVEDFDLLSLAVDTVIFGVDTEKADAPQRKLSIPFLKVLLVKRTEHPFLGRWSLPGGFVDLQESLEETALRVISRKTGFKDLYLEQLFTFGRPDRDPRARVVSCAYLALLDKTYELFKESDVGDNFWFSLSLSHEDSLLRLSSPSEEMTLPLFMDNLVKGRSQENLWRVLDNSPLAFDHGEIILAALMRIRGKIEYSDLAFSLMPEKFTLSQLMTVYEIILGEKLLPAAFRRKIAGKVVPTQEYVTNKQYRPGRLFRYKGNAPSQKGELL